MNEYKFFQDAINKQMEFGGFDITFEDLIKEKDGWYTRYTLHSLEEQGFKNWFINEYCRRSQRSKKYATRVFDGFWLTHGLKVDKEKYIVKEKTQT